MSKMNDQAEELAKALQESEQFLNLKEAYEKVVEDEMAKELFERFRDIQMNLHEKQTEGEDITEEEAKSANEVVAEVQQNEQITHLLETEEKLNTTINELSQIITKPLEQMYNETTP